MRPADRFDAFLLDLDGVLYRGARAVPGAAEAVGSLRAAGKRIVFLTNNSARTPDQVAAKLEGMGIQAAPDEVVTSAQPTAAMLARSDDGRSPSAYVVGQDGIRAALADAGIEILEGEPEVADFVVVGWDDAVTYDRLRVAAVLVRRGARLVATNDDASFPAPGGELWPGAGAILAAVETASGGSATVVGKPHRPLFEAALERAGTRRAVMVGDRVETDVVGAVEAGLEAVLVLSGAAQLGHVLDHDALPAAVLDDLSGLLASRPWARVRATRPEDLDAVRGLLEAAGLDPAEGDDPSTAVVAGEDEVVATAAADVRGAEAYLRSVAVRPDLRGQHLGVLVAAGAVRRVVAAGARRAWLLTETAERFFARLGFERVERNDVPSWILERATHCAETAAAMRRELSQ